MLSGSTAKDVTSSKNALELQGGADTPGTGSLQRIVAQGRVSSPAPAAKFHWEATNTYLPSRSYSERAAGAATACQVMRQRRE